MNFNKTEAPSFDAISRVARAVTYPVLSLEHDLTIRELYALCTLPEAIDLAERLEPSGDVVDAYMLMPGLGNGFLSNEHLDVFKSLEAKGLISVKEGKHRCLAPIRDEIPATLVVLTKCGLALLHAMGGNLKASFDTLDRPDVRESLDGYKSGSSCTYRPRQAPSWKSGKFVVNIDNDSEDNEQAN